MTRFFVGLFLPATIAMDFWRSTPSPDLYLPVFSSSVSPVSIESSPLAALKNSCFDPEQDHLQRFTSPVDEQDADLLLHFATSPLSHKTPASSRSSAHTPTSKSSSSASGDAGRHHTKKRALSPFTPQDFDKAYPLQYNISPLSISPIIRTSSPEFDPLDPNPAFYVSYKRRCLQRVPETPQKSSPHSGVDDLSPLSSISSISGASSEDSPLASRSSSSFVRASVSPSPSPALVTTSSRIPRISRPNVRRSFSSPRTLGSPAYRRRKLESLATSPKPLRSQMPLPRLRSRLVRLLDDSETDDNSGRGRLPALRLPPISTTASSVDSICAEELSEDGASSLPLRTFPPEVKLDHRFSLFYIRYPVYSCSRGDIKRYSYIFSHLSLERNADSGSY